MALKKRASEYGRTISSQSITNISTSTALTVPAQAVSALITALTKNVSFRTDGQAPTAGVGHLLSAGGSVEIFGDDLTTARFIQTEATATLFVTYFGE